MVQLRERLQVRLPTSIDQRKEHKRRNQRIILYESIYFGLTAEQHLGAERYRRTGPSSRLGKKLSRGRNLEYEARPVSAREPRHQVIARTPWPRTTR
jgi:hypothetical protein